MNVYILSFFNECGAHCEREFEAPNTMVAISHALALCEGNEGLWGCFSLSDGDTEFEFNPF